MVEPGARIGPFSNVAADAVPASAAEPVTAARAARAAPRRTVVVSCIEVSCGGGGGGARGRVWVSCIEVSWGGGWGGDVVDDATTSSRRHAGCLVSGGAAN